MGCLVHLVRNLITLFYLESLRKLCKQVCHHQNNHLGANQG